MKTKEIMNEQLAQIADGWMQKSAPTFDDLSDSIIQTHQSAQYTAIRAINQMATLRNWLIGCYIVEYEQKGSDRASLMPTHPILRRMRCMMATILQQVSCSALAKARRWWNTPLQAWTPSSLSLLICFNCRIKPRSRSSCTTKCRICMSKICKKK